MWNLAHSGKKQFIFAVFENDFDDEKSGLEQKYAAMFGHGVPGERFPPVISEDEIMKAVESCVQNQKDELITVLPIPKIEEPIEESSAAEPGDISFPEDCDDIGNGKVWLVTQTKQKVRIIELTDHKKLDHR